MSLNCLENEWYLLMPEKPIDLIDSNLTVEHPALQLRSLHGGLRMEGIIAPFNPLLPPTDVPGSISFMYILLSIS